MSARFEAARGRLDSLREGGGAEYDPLGQALVITLLGRAEAEDEGVQAILLGRIEALGRCHPIVLEILPTSLLDEADWLEVIETFYDVADRFWRTGLEEHWGVACAMARAERRAISSI